MNIEYLIVGVAKESQEDFHELYQKMKVSVYSLSLSIVKNKSIARDIAAETFKRIKQSAYKFDTDLNGEYWILDIAYRLSCNALTTPALQNQLARQRIDNASLLLGELINNSKNDRASIILLRLLSSLRQSDIAKLLNYYKSSCKAEYNRGITQLKIKNNYYSKNEIISILKEDAIKACPDYWAYIESDSSEQMAGLSDESINYVEKIDITNNEETPKASRRIILTCFIVILLVSLVTLVIYFFFKDKESPDTYDSTVIQYENTTAMISLGSHLYYCSENGKDLCSINPSKDATGKVIVTGAYPKEIVTDGTYLYYRNQSDGYIYKTSTDGAEPMRISYMPGVSLDIHDNHIYFGSTGGIYRVNLASPDLSAAEPELILDTTQDSSLFCVDLEVGADGTVYFCSGAGKGIHEIYTYEGTPLNQGLFTDEAYTIMYDNEYLYFDYVVKNEINLYKINLETQRIFTVGRTYSTYDTINASLTYEGDPIILETGAFQVVNTVTYFAAKDGIYKVGFDGGKPELVVSKTLDNAITDFLVTEDYIFCYYSDGKKDSTRHLISYKISDSSPMVIY